MIFRGRDPVGRVASASYGHTLAAAVTLGRVSAPEAVHRPWFEAGSHDIEIGMVVTGRRVLAQGPLRLLYDLKSERAKSW
ncbi:glycine cleavage T C-terminal barrel domain-containing protein [Streptomyces scabiei]|uniref:glycine cleavage T C-terminal barrel domain-containing protein n=1 Tax=Streptomyces scabiei TaxID=1930 RepID=UPI0039EEEE3A